MYYKLQWLLYTPREVLVGFSYCFCLSAYTLIGWVTVCIQAQRARHVQTCIMHVVQKHYFFLHGILIPVSSHPSIADGAWYWLNTLNTVCNSCIYKQCNLIFSQSQCNKFITYQGYSYLYLC